MDMEILGLRLMQSTVDIVRYLWLIHSITSWETDKTNYSHPAMQADRTTVTGFGPVRNSLFIFAFT